MKTWSASVAAWISVALIGFAGMASAQTAPAGASNPNSFANMPKRPFFGIDSVAHSSRGGALVLSADERHAVTVGNDATLRIWDVQTGELLQRFFLPKASDTGSRLMAVDLSPDGRFAAVAGYGMRGTVVVLSLQTGRVERFIRDTEDTLSLSWSPDGRHIAAGRAMFGKQRGVRIVEAATGREVFSDPAFAGEISGLQYRANGDLFAAAWQTSGSTVKLYKPDGAGGYRIAATRQPTRWDWRPYWDAAGRHVQLGGGARLDGETLEEKNFDADRRFLPNDTGFGRVRQSPDGKTLFGASWSRSASSGVLRRWSGDRAIDSYSDLKLPDTQIRDIVVTRRNEVVYIDESGTVGMVGADFKLAWRVAHDVAALDRRPGDLKVTDAGHVLLPLAGEGAQREIAFSLASAEFMPAARVRESWKSPSATGGGVRVLAWEGTGSGTINNARFPLTGQGERVLSVAVHAGDRAVAFGTSWQRLYRADERGRKVWEKYLASNVVAVNLIEARDMVVAATANGMLRVFRWSTGDPVVSYYLQPGSRRWIAISADGYYEASTGAEELAGWIVNPGSPRVADFMPLSRFRQSLLLTGLGRRAWETGREADAVKALLAARPAAPAQASRPNAATPVAQAAPAAAKPPAASPPPQGVAAGAGAAPAPVAANTPPASQATAPVAAPAAAPATPAVASEGQNTESTGDPVTAPAGPSAVRLEEIPPRIELITPGFNAESAERTIRIRFRALTPDGAPLTQVRAMVASSAVASRAVVGSAAAVASVSDEREVSVEIPPEDSEIRLIAENRFGASVPMVIRVRFTGQRTQLGKGNLYILAAGVSQYDNPQYNLGLAAKDAQDFVQTLSRQRGLAYGEVFVRQLVDKAASKRDVEAGFEWLRQNMTARDTAVVFLAGHGMNDGPAYYFLTRDVKLDSLPSTAVPFDRIRSAMTSLPGRALIFVDTCHSGNVLGRLGAQARDSSAAINDLASSENGLVVFASSTGAQVSQEDPAWGNGAFTKAVVEGLQGAADFKKRGRITYKGLDAYVSDRVDELTKGTQTPVTPVLQGVPDFVIAQTR